MEKKGWKKESIYSHAAGPVQQFMQLRIIYRHG